MPYTKGQFAVAEYTSYSGTGPSISRQTRATFDSFILSEDHNIGLLGKANVGGPFELAKQVTERQVLSLPPYKRGSSPLASWTGGNFCCSVNGEANNLSSGSSLLVLKDLESASFSKSASTVAASLPVRPESDMVVAVLEVLKDGIPKMAGSSLWREKTQLARGAGKEYLNAQFGWVPLVSDIRDFARVVKTSSDIIAQFERNSGKRQRRFRTVDHGYSPLVHNTYTGVSVYPPNTELFFLTNSDRYSTTSTRIWFSGAFKYFLPETGMSRYASLANKLYGIRLTPDVLWKLAPWSWAADWFGNVGDVLTNVSYLGSDACVMEWGYMMNELIETRRIEATYTARAATGGGFIHPQLPSGAKVPLSTTQTTSYKTRIVANPYSFSVTPVPLTTKQSAIVAALGLTKL